jgi:putative two-component system response regulator
VKQEKILVLIDYFKKCAIIRLVADVFLFGEREIVMERNTLLIVDDVEINREMLKEIFEEQYDILEAADGEEAIQVIEENFDRIALVFMDLVMPKKSGIDVLKEMQEKKYTDCIPVMLITAENTVDADLAAYEYGASDIIYKPFNPRVVMRRTKNIIEMFSYRMDIERKLEKRTRQLRESQEKIERHNEFLINALSSVVEFRSVESGEHVQRVKHYTGILLRQLVELYPEYGFSEEDVQLMINASALHDIGKIAIPDNILLKPGRLTAEEFEIMKTHTTRGCEILEQFKQEDSAFYRYCYDICRYHHERYDGKGYPDGLVGDEIPIWAQVVSIVDVYDALVSKRVYKEAYSVMDAIDMIFDGQCGVFSPKILDCFQMAKAELIVLQPDEEETL